MPDPQMIIPFSLLWHDEQDFHYGHCPMPYNAAGEGPEMDESKVVKVVCWCWRRENCPVIPPELRGPD